MPNVAYQHAIDQNIQKAADKTSGKSSQEEDKNAFEKFRIDFGLIELQMIHHLWFEFSGVCFSAECKLLLKPLKNINFEDRASNKIFQN